MARRREKSASEITAQRVRLQQAAYKKYGTHFTSRNLSIVNAYNNVMGRLAKNQVANRAAGLANG